MIGHPLCTNSNWYFRGLRPQILLARIRSRLQLYRRPLDTHLRHNLPGERGCIHEKFKEMAWERC
jgi:hypothetical protein